MSGNISEITVCQHVSSGLPCIKIDKDNYCDTRTGELLKYSHIENRSQSLDSIRSTLSKIRGLINSNILDADFCRWVTLTYKENMTDSKKLYEDFRRFWGRFSYWCTSQNIIIPEYISVVEPQGRGAWHVHAFFIWSEKAPFISNSILADLWQNGFVKIKALKDVDNIGAYFSAYLGDIPLNELSKMDIEVRLKCSRCPIDEKNFIDDEGFIKKKDFIKGGRLFLYPPGMNIVRSSRGIKKPVVERTTYELAQKKVSSAKETFSRSFEILGVDGCVVNTISKSFYNSKILK